MPTLNDSLASNPVAFAPAIKRGDAGFNGGPAVVLSIQKQPTADTVDLTKRLENALADMANPDDPPVQALLRAIQDFYLKEIDFWVSTDVDAIMFMDDWGSQNSLLIPPSTWREVFKPLYRDYCNLARRHGKFVFMHSDGYILDIYQDLAEIGVHAINSQIFCMGLEQVAAAAKGKLTFWGEIDRQHIIPSANPEAGRAAVRQVLQHLGDPRGGIIAQLEFGPGGNPRTVQAICEEWEAASGVTASRVPGF